MLLCVFSRASRMLWGATQPVRMPCVSVCVCVCVCVEIFFQPTPISKLVWPISMKFGMMGGLRV